MLKLIRNKKENGFTLIELLVVISIIAVLMSIMMPSLQRARAQAKMVICSNNLKQIGTVFQLYANDNKMCFPEGINWSSTAWFANDELTKYLPTESTWQEGEDAQGVYKGYYCTENFKTLTKDDDETDGQGYGPGYSMNYYLGAFAYTKVAKVKNQASTPLFNCFFIDEDTPTGTSGKPEYMGNYFAAAFDPAESKESWKAYYLMEGMPDVHKGLGSNFLMVDGHVEKCRPMDTQEEYAQKYTWDAPGAYVVTPYTPRYLEERND
ncbi:MAG: type II secretion system protein [Sedimentisphaeraceae bacterium JB056]